jgi:hypothetical protein
MQANPSSPPKQVGIFSKWQPQYASHGIPTFPVEFGDGRKKPAVSGYLRLGLPYSNQLALKFPANDALGFALRRARIAVLDIDTPDERVRDDAFARHGQPAIAVRTISGHWQGWYRHNGEPRSVKPWPDRPIDILGHGYVCAPPSLGPAGRYEFVQGGLDALDRLTVLRNLDLEERHPRVHQGVRDDWLFHRMLREVKACDDFETVLDVARTMNMSCIPPLSDAQVVSKAKQAWTYEIEGRNWVGRKARASTDREEILALSHSPTAAMLLNLLRVSHPKPDARFAIDQVATGKVLGWSRGTVRSSIEALVKAKLLKRVHRGGRNVGDPHLYELLPPVSKI